MKGIFIVFLVGLSTLSFSQQEPQYSMFWNNYSLFNPANTASSQEIISLGANYRTKFVDSGIQPHLCSVNYENKIEKINSGVGFGYSFDKVKLSKSNKIYLNYAYHLSIGKRSSLNFGISFDYNIRKYNNTWYGPDGQNDPSLPYSNPQGKVNVNLGILFRSEKLKLGMSLTQVNTPFFDELSFTNARHIFWLASYNFHIKNTINYTPTIYYKGDFVNSIIEINNMFDYKKKVFLGVTYRDEDAVSVQLGYQLKLYTRSSNSNGAVDMGALKGASDLLKIMYSYDINIGPLAEYGFNTHELSFIYKIFR